MPLYSDVDTTSIYYWYNAIAGRVVVYPGQPVYISVSLIPMAVAVPKLIALKEKGRLEYGVLSMVYSKSFDQKWIQKTLPVEEPLLGSGDIQSLADLSNSF